MHWSPQQDAALKAVSDWLSSPSSPQIFRLFGFAGSGKTTLAVHLAQDIEHVCFASFTGKAALVMRRKGCRDASTIHSLIYSVDDETLTGEPRFILNSQSEVKHAKLVVIDEASMVGQELAEDLLSFGTKVLVLGDPAQLPPVKDAGYFTECQPDLMLTEIHRQARDNPIIRLSMDVREGQALAHGKYGATKVIARNELDPAEVTLADQVLVGLNRTRISYNRRMRELLGFAAKSEYPVPDEKLICLRNERTKGLLNGGMWSVKKSKAKGPKMKLRLAPEEDEAGQREVEVLKAFFDGSESELDWNARRNSSEFTYGYAITVHKSQGSQWNHVVLFDESASFRDDARRWLYTGITRAAEALTIVKPC